jgi:HPt (histidine-containing phosphotransfer) domain-containing protein
LGAHGSLDLAKALAQLEGDRQLLVEISQIFIETYPKLLEQIHHALAASNQQQLIAAAHTLASSAGQIGAVKGHAMAKKLEEIGRRNELSLATSTAAELDAEIRLVASAISSDASPYSSLPQAEA